MAPDHLGLFDTPPNRQEIRFALAIVGLLLAALFLIIPLLDIRLREIDAFIPMIDAVMFVGELIIATLLYVQAAVFRSRALTVLATGFVFAALLLIPHALTFPGAFAPNGVLEGGVNTTAWIFTTPTSSVSHRRYPICAAQTGGIGNRSLERYGRRQGSGLGCLQQLSLRQRSRRSPQSDMTCSHRFSAIIPTEIRATPSGINPRCWRFTLSR